MSKIKILSLDDYLPRYKVLLDGKVKVVNGKETEIGTLETGLKDKINLVKEKENLQTVIKDEEKDWVRENILLGEFGEKIAFNYLSSIHSNVSNVSSKAYLGYDIEINEDNVIGVEVKTAKYKNAFHITYNELNKALTMKERYFLFFIKVNDLEDDVTGYLIKDPIKSLNIDLNQIINNFDTQKVNLIPNKFYVQFHHEYIQTLQKLNLDNFI